MRSPKAIIRDNQEQYIRNREDPFFNGLFRDNDRVSTFNFQGNVGSQNVSWSSSDNTDNDMRHNKIVPHFPDKVMNSPLEDVVSDNILEPFDNSSSQRWSKIAIPTIEYRNSLLGMSLSNGDSIDNYSNTGIVEEHEESVFDLGKPTNKKSYSVNKRISNVPVLSLPQSAASFYNGWSPLTEVVESSESISRLNLYLRARREDVNAGVPGRFLCAVMGQDVFDVGSVASTIMYAFYLNETQKYDTFCIVPIINTKRIDLSYHAELIWLLDSCQIDQSSLIFIDEIDLSYYDLFGSLKLVLLNNHKLPTKQEALREAIIEIFNCRKGESVYSWVETVTVGEGCSCCTLIAEKFALKSPVILTGQGFSRLLLAGILLDTENLTSLHCTSKDKYIATLLINGAGHFGCNGFHQILKYKMYGVADSEVVESLYKDLKKWTRVGNLENSGSKLIMPHVGMSSIGISIGQLLSEADNSTQDIKSFQKMERLQVLVVVSGYYDAQKNFKREILVIAESLELMKNLLIFFNSNASRLPLKVLHLPGIYGEFKAFEIDKVTSRRTIERLLEELSTT